MKKEKNKEEFSFFDHLRNVDEQHGICGKNVIFKSISNFKDSENTAFVGVEAREKEQQYCASLYIRCPYTDIVDAVLNSKKNINKMLEGVIKNFRYSENQESFSADYDNIFAVYINKELYLCFHRWFGQCDHIPFEKMFEITAATYNDVASVIMKVYWRFLYGRLQEKKKILFDELLMRTWRPQTASFVVNIILGKYKKFCGELNHEYLAELKKLCPREYERLMLSKNLLNFRSKKKE